MTKLLCAVYLENKNWGIAFDRITEALNFAHFKIVRMRWVDDLLTIISTRAEMSSKTSDAIVSALCTAYTPFNLKIEDASVFVGFSLVIFDASTAPYIRSDIAIPRGIHFCNKGRTRAEIVSGSARLPHGLANL